MIDLSLIVDEDEKSVGLEKIKESRKPIKKRIKRNRIFSQQTRQKNIRKNSNVNPILTL